MEHDRYTDPWLTTAQAAEYVGCKGPSTIRKWMQRGLLQPDGRRGPRGSWLFRQSNLDSFLADCALTHPRTR